MSTETVPAAHRAAFAAAVHLSIREPGRFAWSDVRFESGAFRLYTEAVPPIDASKAEREAFYNQPARVCTGAELASELAAAGVYVAPVAGRVVPVGCTVRRVRGLAGKPANPQTGLAVFDPPAGFHVYGPDGELVAVGKRAVVEAILEPVVPVKRTRKAALVPPPVAPSPAPVAEVVELRPVGDLPVVVVEWLDRLVYADKRAYAEAWARHMIHGAPAPTDPGAAWASKARARFARLTIPAHRLELVTA